MNDCSTESINQQLSQVRGVANADIAKQWCIARRIEDVECIVTDQAGVARGKLMPTEKFFGGTSMRLPASILTQSITGDYPPDDRLYDEAVIDGDLIFKPDFSTFTIAPWASDPTAQVLHDPFFTDGSPVDFAPRRVLQRIVDLYRERDLIPIVAPELEFYLVKPNHDADYPLEPPVGKSGRPQMARQAYSISAVNEFEDLFDDVYEFSEIQGLEIDTLAHEDGTSQMEINLQHGDPVELADQVFLFKRTIREAALRHNMHATFMAKPIAAEPGSSMHIHHSVIDAASKRNIFSNEDGTPTPEFFSYIAGLQTFAPRAMALMAPFVNSYRRLARFSSAPINVGWGYDNRTVGLRVPLSDPGSRRVENRLPSSDANPYLAIAASLACGYLGLLKKLEPEPPVEGTAYDQPHTLPQSILDAVRSLEDTPELVEILGGTFVQVYRSIKDVEYDNFMSVISPWEREYLLLSV